jgi:hypothetical protein
VIVLLALQGDIALRKGCISLMVYVIQDLSVEIVQPQQLLLIVKVEKNVQ